MLKITFEVERFCDCQNNKIEWILGINELQFRCAQCRKILPCPNAVAYIIIKNPNEDPLSQVIVKDPDEDKKIPPKERPWPPTIAYYRKELEDFLKETLPEEDSVVEPKKEMIH